MFTHVIVHYAEIGLKGKNRGYFEKVLVNNIRRAVKEKIERRFGSIIVILDKSSAAGKIQEALACTPGIAHFSFAVEARLTLAGIKRTSLMLARRSRAKSFRITASRSDKRFPYTSRQVNELIGAHVKEKTGMSVDLENPQMTVFIEIGSKEAFAYTEKIPGIGGLPVGSSGTLVSLMSGGIDSPVSSFLMMKRGCKMVFVHFHNYDLLLDEKIPKLVEELALYQGKSKLYVVPFKKLQEKIIEKIEPRYRFLIYRRFMLRIAACILEKEKAKGFVTGDSVGQVASQTLENLNVIYSASEHPVFAPLAGMNKEEITALAKHIGTYETSIMPYSDCCTYMTAKHPATKADKKEVARMERKLSIRKLVDEAMRHGELKVIG
ncbi:MAG: tRNA 4-thiouridine(8) synthase ThiI [Candidatus Aenigmarchaeota archaeon]|nr:tRNA 4-thiouridine(8) synthase ThiI [Candidatus Aenigmarchaeota archaeon]